MSVFWSLKVDILQTLMAVTRWVGLSGRSAKWDVNRRAREVLKRMRIRPLGYGRSLDVVCF